MKGFKHLLIFFLLLLGGCAVGPNYQTPHIALPSNFSEETTEEEFDVAALTSWWTTFNDPLLDVLMHEAISHNFDLQIALEKIILDILGKSSIIINMTIIGSRQHYMTTI